jgi:hypothetical protein
MGKLHQTQFEKLPVKKIEHWSSLHSTAHFILSFWVAMGITSKASWGDELRIDTRLIIIFKNMSEHRLSSNSLR